jgi:type VI secretion system protein ImpC
MRAILHDPGFQALEAAWRSLDYLVRGIDDDDPIQVYVLDIPKQKLAAELAQPSGFRDTAVYQIIVEQPASTAGAGLWSLIAGNYSFDRSSAEDVDLLTTLGLLARSARAPFLAEVLPYPGGERAALESWLALRQSAYASWVGLAIPRLLLRLPYGKDTRVVEAFDFEEMPGMPRHTDYLWGNPAFACASLIARSFAEVGGSFRPGMHLELERLPLHVYKVGAETRVQPCAELLLSERDQEELLRQGLIPLTWVKGRDSARLIRFQSIADPPAALSGRWS